MSRTSKSGYFFVGLIVFLIIVSFAALSQGERLVASLGLRGASESPSASVYPSPSPSKGPVPVAQRLTIPSLSIDLAVIEEPPQGYATKDEIPDGVAIHRHQNVQPGQSGNAYIYAHAREGAFLNLWDARVGDTVTVAMSDGRVLKYRVDEIHDSVDPNNGWVWLNPDTPDERLTLETCKGDADPQGENDPRLVVICHRSVL